MLLRRGVALLALAALVMATFGASLKMPPQSVRALALYNSGDPSAQDQQVLEYINRARANPIAEGQRLGIDIHEGLNNPSYVGPRPPLAMNPILLGTASAHSYDMYTNNYFSHNDLNGNTPFQRMANAGYNFMLAGENMAAGTYMPATELEDLMMVDAGEQGRPHRVNLLDIWPYPCGSPPCIYYEVGIGYYEGTTPNSIGNAFITEDFGATSASPFLLGVVYDDKNGNNFYDIGEGISGVTITPSSGSYYAVSSSSGGYAMPIGTSGTITVTASGPGFGPITKTVTLAGMNMKLDFTRQSSSLNTSTTSSQSFTQTFSTSTSQTNTQTFQPVTQTTTVTQSSIVKTTLQTSPSYFMGTTYPASISACGSTYTNGQTLSGCGSFTATANLPTPSTGWRFDHWVWTGLTCSSTSSNSVTCTSPVPGGYLTAVYSAQVNFVTNPISSALTAWGNCANQQLGNGNSIFSTGYGSVSATACYVPTGYAISSWSCSGGLACSGSSNPTTINFSGPGTLTLNLQPQSVTSTASSTSSTSKTTMVNTTTTDPAPEFAFDPMLIVGMMVFAVLILVRPKPSRQR